MAAPSPAVLAAQRWLSSASAQTSASVLEQLLHAPELSEMAAAWMVDEFALQVRSSGDSASSAIS